MTILKLKVILYRYTGIFLAYREEREFLTSQTFWSDFKERYNNPNNDWTEKQIQSFLLGSWEDFRGFIRPAGLINKKGFLFNTIDWFYILFCNLKWDVQNLIKKVL